jgi:hypothetical protein
LSFCCAVDGCRARATPPSLRFLGRKVYLGAVVVLAETMRQGPTAARVRQLTELVGASRRILARWRARRPSAFVASRFWKAVSAAFMPPVDQRRLPASLLKRFAGDGAAKLVALGPISGGSTMHAAWRASPTRRRRPSSSVEACFTVRAP